MVRLLGKGTAQYGKDGKRGSMLADAFCLLKGVVAAIVFWMLVDLLLPSRTAPPAPSASVVYHTPALPVVAPLQARPRHGYGFGSGALVERSRASSTHKPREGGLVHPTDTSRSNLEVGCCLGFCFRGGGFPNPKSRMTTSRS